MGKILNRLAIPVVMFALLSAMTACNTSGCTELKSATPRADFYSAVSGKAITLDSMSITGVGVRGDSAIFETGKSASSVYLPMPPRADTVKWAMEYHWSVIRGMTDTITITYDRLPWFAGVECGAMFRYRIRRVDYTRNLIDSIGVADSLVTNVDRATLNIYFLIDSRP